MSAYIAHGESTMMICSYDKRASRALKKAARAIDKVMFADQYANPVALNISFDDEGYYQVTAIIATMR